MRQTQFKKRQAPTEKQIETAIIQWLRHKGVLAFKVENGGVFDQKRGLFRFNHALRTKGVADIIGIFMGRPLAIEVKSAKGKLSTHQLFFLEDWKAQGGIAIVARSVEDVEKALGAA